MTLIPDAGPCPRCGGKLEIKTTVENPTSGPPVHFFRCKDCGHVHTVERRSVASGPTDGACWGETKVIPLAAIAARMSAIGT